VKTFIPKNAQFLAVGLLTLMLGSSESRAQGPDGRSFGTSSSDAFGLVAFDPLGATMQIWTNPVNTLTLTFDIGESDFGPTRLDADYLFRQLAEGMMLQRESGFIPKFNTNNITLTLN
jgi:hypothetical protein